MRSLRAALCASLVTASIGLAAMPVRSAVAQPVPPGWAGPHYYWHHHWWHHRGRYYHGPRRLYRYY